MSTFLVVALLSATAPVKVAAPGLAGTDVSPELLAFVNERLSQQLALEGLEMMPPANLAAVIGPERQKQLLDCGDASCMTELANALGVDAILVGSLARLEALYQLDVRLVAATDGRSVAPSSRRVQTDAQLLDAIREAAAQMAPQLAKKLGRSLSPVAPGAQPPPVPVRGTTTPEAQRQAAPAAEPLRYQTRPTATRNVGQWLMIGGGIAAGVSLLGLSVGYDLGFDEATTIGLVSLLLGGAAVAVTGLIVFLVGGTERVPINAALVPVPGGGVLSVGATF